MQRCIFIPLFAATLSVANHTAQASAKPSSRTRATASAKKSVNPQRAPSQVVRLYVGTLSSVGAERPAASLVSSLTQHPNVSEFIVGWDGNGLGTSNVCSVRYHRSSRTLELDHSTYGSHVDSASKTKVEETADESWVYMGVTEAILQRLAHKNASNDKGADAQLGYFPRLVQLGCKVRKTQNLHRINRKKLSA